MMMEEQLLEVNKKISQIQGILQRRKQRMSEWKMPVKKVLEDKPDKTFYLDRSCSTSNMLKTFNSNLKNSANKQIIDKVQQSRQKIRNHYNELKELDLLQKQKNKIRAIIVQRKQAQRIAAKQNVLVKFKEVDGKKKKNKQNEKKVLTKVENIQRTTKQRTNPFDNAKPDKFIELYHQFKNSEDNLAPKLMRHFGVGIQNTPLGANIKKQVQKVEQKAKKEKVYSSKASKNKFAEGFTNTFNRSSNIFGNNRAPNLFQDRIKKIIKYHGDFWNQQLQIK